MSRRVDFDAGARRRLGERWGAEEGKRGSQVPATNALSPRAGASLAFFLAIGLFVGILHGARGRGFLSHVPGRGAVAHGAAAVGRGSRGSEVDVRDSVTTAVGVVGALALSFGAAGAELQVPSKQYPTIQSAIDAAVDGDVVVLAAGVFTESCVVQGKSIEIRGAGADQTTWVAQAASRCLWMPFLDTKAMIVADIHFTGFSMPYNAAAVDLESTGAHRVSRCRFSASGYFALEVFGTGAIVEDCDFVGNIGQAVSMTLPIGQTDGEQLMLRCRFRDNQSSAWGAAITAYNTRLRVESCRFERNNVPAGNGIAIDVGQVTIVDSEFCESVSTPVVGDWVDGGGNTFSAGPCTPPCPGDFLADGTVNAADLGILLNFWGTDGSGFPGVDLDGDGIVGAPDLATLLSSWGACPE